MVTRFLAVLSASAILVAALAPTAFAQVSIGGDVQYVDCSQVQTAVGNQGQYANAGTGGTATAEVAAELNITQEQVNECLGGGGDDGGGDDGDKEQKDPNDPDRGEETTVVKGKTIILDDVAAAQLPKTGGASVPGASFPGVALAAGCALLGAGLLVNRVLR